MRILLSLLSLATVLATFSTSCASTPPPPATKAATKTPAMPVTAVPVLAAAPTLPPKAHPPTLIRAARAVCRRAASRSQRSAKCWRNKPIKFACRQQLLNGEQYRR